MLTRPPSQQHSPPLTVCCYLARRFERKKGIGLAIRALHELLQREQSGNGSAAAEARLVIAGGYDARLAENREHLEELQALVEELGLHERVRFVPSFSDRCGVQGTRRRACDWVWVLGCGRQCRGWFCRSAYAVWPCSAGQGVWQHRVAAGLLNGVSEGGKARLHWAGQHEGNQMQERRLPRTLIASLLATARPGLRRRGPLHRCPSHALTSPRTPHRQRTLLLAACVAVIYTPQNEHFGIVPLEAMAARRPVVACNNGGPLESVVDGTTGLLCEPTPAAFAAAYARLLQPGAAEAMAEAARRHVEGKFSRGAFGVQLEAHVLGMLRRRG